jgi:hypothetical protein
VPNLSRTKLTAEAYFRASKGRVAPDAEINYALAVAQVGFRSQLSSRCVAMMRKARVAFENSGTICFVVPGLQSQPYAALADLELGDILFLALMADAVGIWVSDVPSLLGDEAQDGERDQPSSSNDLGH